MNLFEWYHRWQAQMGRPMRILHIGNIANNAFNNARIQRLYDIDAYVIAHESYHVMSAPEWEEATFVGDYGDPFFPDWTRVDLAGYERPRWFASGPLQMCCDVIASQVDERSQDTDWLVLKLKAAREAICAQTYRGLAIRQMSRVRRRARSELQSLREGISSNDGTFDWKRISEIWGRANVPRDVPVRARDFSGYASRLGRLKDLFQHFDIIQAYATDGAWPLLVKQPYVAYEHGTLRALPFERNASGRLTSTVFMGADHVLVTNIDCLEPAARLGISSDRVTALPHAFNDKRLFEFRERHGDLKPPDDHVVFFHPARQDWRDPDPSLTKGNDRLIRAFARIRRTHPTAMLRMVAWGRDLAASRDLVGSIGIADDVQWVEPLQKYDLWKAYLSSHAVLDQFATPTFGGVTFEALALGCRVVTNVHVADAERFFIKAPPVYSVSSEDEIVLALERIILDQHDADKVGDAGADWIRKYHSAERIVELQLGVYRRLLKPGCAMPIAEAE